MEKSAKTIHNIHPILKKRWSPRAFTSKAVEKEKISRIFEAARWSPSAFNEQPWRFILGQKGSQTWNKIFNTLVEFNQAWAKNADILVITVGRKTLTDSNKPNGSFHYDVGQSVAHLTFQVMHEGLHMHQMGGFSKEKAFSAFNIPEEYEPLTVLAIGYIGEPEILEGNFIKMEKSPRERKPFNDILFEDNFGQALAL